MVATHTSADDHVRCIKAFERILAGQNRYYKSRLQDPEFDTGPRGGEGGAGCTNGVKEYFHWEIGGWV